METKQKHKVTPESAYAWLVKRQQRKRELQEQFQKDCDSGRIQELLKMQNPPSEKYKSYFVNDDYVFTTDDERIYSVTFEEQPFFEDDEFILADRTYEIFLTLQKAPPAYSKDPRIGATLTAII